MQTNSSKPLSALFEPKPGELVIVERKRHQGSFETTTLPLLSEGARYRVELICSEKVVSATLLRIVEDSPLGRGFSFQLRNRRLFVYERDLLPGPDGMLLAMVA
jgi:hypothetical protein